MRWPTLARADGFERRCAALTEMARWVHHAWSEGATVKSKLTQVGIATLTVIASGADGGADSASLPGPASVKVSDFDPGATARGTS